MVSIDWTQIFLALIGILGTIVTTYIIPYLKSKTNEHQQDIVVGLANVAVYAAQQLFEDNTAKKAYALQAVSDGLKKWKINLTEEEILVYIESALKDIKTSIDKAEW